MGIDYRASSGIGYAVCESDELNEDEEMEEDLEDGLEEYIDCNCGEDFDCFGTGNGYSGSIDGIYLILKEPFKDGLDLTKAKEKLDEEVKRLRLDTEDEEFGVVGGLYIY
jgi:hypothetical protein